MRIEGRHLALYFGLVCFGVLPFAYFRPLLDAARLPQLVVLCAGMLPLLAAFVFAKGKAAAAPSAGLSPISILMVVLVLWSGLSMAWSINAAEAWFYTVQLGLGIGFFLVSQEAIAKLPNLLLVVVKVLTVAMSVLAAIGILQWLKIDPLGTSDAKHSPVATMTNPNFYADALLFGLPFCIYGALKFPGRVWRALAMTAIVLLIAGIAVSRARSSLMPPLLAALVFAPVVIWKKVAPLWRAVSMELWAVFMVIAIWSTTYVFRTKEGTFNFNYIWEKGHVIGPRTSSVDFRFIVWHQTLDLASEDLLKGCGAGNWKMNIQRHGVKGFDEKAGYGLRVPLQPHHEYLGVLAELGLSGLLLVLAIGGLGFRGAWKQAWDRSGKADRTLGACLLLGLFFFFFDASFSFPMERPFQMMMLFWMLALSQSGLARPLKGAPKWQVRLGWGLVAVALVVAIPTLAARIPAEMAMLQLRTQKEKHQPQKMLQTAEKAQNWAIQLDNASAMPVDWYVGMAYAELGQMPAALEAMERALKAAPYQFGVRSGYASILDMAGRSQEGAKMLSDLLVTFPDYEEGWLNLAIMYIHAGQLGEARKVHNKLRPAYAPEKYQLIDQTLRAAGQ